MSPLDSWMDSSTHQCFSSPTPDPQQSISSIRFLFLKHPPPRLAAVPVRVPKFEQHVKQQESEQLLEKWKPFWILKDNKLTILRVHEIKRNMLVHKKHTNTFEIKVNRTLNI